MDQNNRDDRKAFAEIMYGLADNFSAEINKYGIKFRFDLLKKYNIDQIRAAAHEIALGRKYTKMPTVGELVETIDGSTGDIADMQVELVLAEMRRVGSYGTPVFDDPVTAHIIAKRIGWKSTCGTAERDWKHFIRDFREAYSSCSKISNRKALGIPFSVMDARLLPDGEVVNG